MNQLKRRLSVVVLALVLLALPAAAQAHPAAGAAPAAEPAHWSTFVFDFLTGLLDGLWSVEAASETGTSDTLGSDDAEPGFAPTMDPNGGADALRTTGEFAPTMDPNG